MGNADKFPTIVTFPDQRYTTIILGKLQLWEFSIVGILSCFLYEILCGNVFISPCEWVATCNF